MTCPITGEPLRDNQTISTTALNAIEQALAEVDWLLEDLDVVLSKQSKARPTGAGERDDRPLPYNVGASEAAGTLKAILVGWARLISEETDTLLLCRDTSQSIASWLLHHLDWLGRYEAAPDAYSEIVGAVNHIRRLIDLDPNREYLGICGGVLDGIECVDEVWLIEDDDAGPWVNCRTCGTGWEIIPRRIDQLAKALEHAADRVTLSKAFTNKGVALERTRLDSWVKRGYLHPTFPGGRRFTVAHVARLLRMSWAGEKLSAIEESEAAG
jgi:hypothetical protein